MADLLRVGTSSLLNVQQALNTTGHNITHANTDGYSRQTITFGARSAQAYGFGYVGTGAYVSSVNRATDNFLTGQVQGFTASESRYRNLLSLTSRLDNLVADADASLNASMQSFFNAVQDMASNPSSMPERQVLLSNAGNLAARVAGLNGRFTSLNTEINTQLGGVVRDINTLIGNISAANKEIVSAISSNNGNMPNDLLDHRDRLITQLSEKVGVTVVRQQDGSVNIFAGQGQALVVGEQTNLLATQKNAYDGSKLDIVVKDSPSTTPINKFLTGGEMQALLEFRDNILAQSQAQLGLIALSLTGAFNATQTKGMDLNGAMGGNFFNPVELSLAASVRNSGSAAPGITLTDASQVRASTYKLDYDGTQWTMTRTSDGTSVSGTGTLTLDGMTVDLATGTPAAGDSFQFNPGAQAVSQFAVALKDPARIAAAAPARLDADPDNGGSATLGGLTVVNPAVLPLAATVELRFDPDAGGPGVPGFLVNGGVDGVVAYDPATEGAGKDITLAAYGLRFSASGTPATGDTFTLSSNAGARGDNTNAMAMAGLQSKPLVNGGEDTFQQYYGTLVAAVGTSAREAGSNHTMEASLLDQARLYRDSISGVNLDEEAANMLRYQQAYQASAQMIKVADEIFRTLLDSLR